MLNEVLDLAKELIAIKSIAGNSKELNSALKLVVSKLGEFTVENFESNRIKSVLVYNAKKRPEKFKIILNGHLDVIPGKDYQYGPIIKGNKLFGAGSMDMKANVACLIFVFKKIAKEVDYPLGLQLVTDEEIGGFDGTKYQVGKGVRADFVVAAEPTNFDIVHKAKGVLLLKITAFGKTAHGAYPWRGENAVWKMNEFLNELRKIYPIPKNQKWITTVNLSGIETNNQAFNKIPDDCVVKLDIRYVPKDDKIVLRNIKKILPKGFRMEVVAYEPALSTERNDKYLLSLKKASNKIFGKNIILRGAQGTSDARHYAKVNCAGVEFGPVGGDIGGDNEWVDVKSLEKYCKILEEFLKNII